MDVSGLSKAQWTSQTPNHMETPGVLELEPLAEEIKAFRQGEGG